ncbi:CGNR zinc finger domain-containing protein [Kineosporia sp. J2-2]|uniref:CGNR zinc finger domain-containing protein n=1 Tax=Kineosporia corallincola TaxID=2835133 RepID=A0ABS5TJZ8_9ACTN|nr:CGNR zinc finger domain-containing protein [Kineosporia corallincola]MBT0770714.1 CGNR zinc finger domain-containing protein [Kineosporia corallincola]
MPRFAATERLGTSVAPVTLLLTQELVNSQGPVTYQVDWLVNVTGAQDWLDGVLSDWGSVNPTLTVPGIRLRRPDLERLRTVRDGLHQLLARGEERPFQPEAPQPGPLLDAPLAVRAGPDGVQASPVGTGIGWIASAVALELFRAQEHDLLRRLKLCHNPGCATAFYDRSKNNSRAWHDVATCGNRANVRAYRARQRTTGE